MKLAQFLLRIGLFAVFFYAAVSSFLNPSNWIGFIPVFVREIVDPLLLLKAHSVFQIVLALWILSGWKVFYSAIIASLTMAGILVFNIGTLDILFRDIAILFAGLALASLSKPKKDNNIVA